MNKKILVSSLLIITLFAGAAFAAPLKGMSLNGSTGLVSIPTGRIGWERTADIGLDLGYHAIVDDDTVHIPKVTLSLFKFAEIGVAYDTQTGDDNEDTIIHGKIQLPLNGASAVAIGGNYQMLQRNGVDTDVSQLYLAATYPGSFFDMPAETTFVIGKRFYEDTSDENIDFGMGFDLLLFPQTFQGFIHWINDFSNFSYSNHAYGAVADYRGVFNTGIRIDLATIPAFAKYKFAIDAILTDALDSNRAYSLGVAFGIPVG